MGRMVMMIAVVALVAPLAIWAQDAGSIADAGEKAGDKSVNIGQSVQTQQLFVSSDTVKYSCPVGQRFTLYSKDTDRVTVTCQTPDSSSGAVTSCFQQSGSLCSGQGQFLAQVVEMPDQSGMMSTCCTFKVPAGQQYSESCSTYKVTPKELQQLQHPKKPHDKNAPVVIPAGHEVQSKLFESRDYGSKPPNGNNAAVKALVPTPTGWSVIVCQTGTAANNNNNSPAPAPAPSSSGGVEVGKCTGNSDCAAKCAAVNPSSSSSSSSPSSSSSVGPTKKKRDASGSSGSTLLSSNCDSGTCVCKFDQIPASLKNLPIHQGSGGGAGGICFSGDSVVHTSEGPMTMGNLRVGHKVLVMNEATGQTAFERVDSFIHRRPDIEADFLRLQTTAGNKLTLSPKHLVPVVDCECPTAPTTLKFAKDAAVGECLLVHRDGHITQSQIRSVEQVTKTGIFAPLTKSGNLVVDDVIASCYASYEGHFVQNSFYRMYMALSNWLHGAGAESLKPIDAPPVLHLFETMNSA